MREGNAHDSDPQGLPRLVDQAGPTYIAKARSDRRIANAADDTPKRGGRLASAMRNLLGFDEEDETITPLREPSRLLFDAVGAFLFEQRLEPRPSNYELAYQYVTGTSRRIVDAVDRAIQREGRLTEETADLIMEESRTDLSADSLAKLVDEAQTGLTSIAGLVRQSGADAEAYGQALETGAEAMASGSDPTIDHLLKLTRSMIQKTSEAEQQLRHAGKRMGTLRTNLAEARRVATSDALTGLPNRRAFEERLKTAVVEARGHDKPLSLAFCDIDHFKHINDTHGHEVGDRILKFVAKLLADASGNTCHVARHGGEEFVMLFEGLNARQALEAVEACRQDLAERRLVAKETGEALGQITFSAGVATLTSTIGGRDLLRKADRALYRAKNAGRNRIMLAEASE